MSQEPMMEATSDDKLWALLAYVLSPIVPVIVLLMEDKKNRPFIRAHNAQALAWGLVVYILSAILAPVFGIGLCIGPIGFIINVYWGIQAYGGKMVEIPVISNFVRNQGWA